MKKKIQKYDEDVHHLHLLTLNIL